MLAVGDDVGVGSQIERAAGALGFEVIDKGDVFSCVVIIVADGLEWILQRCELGPTLIPNERVERLPGMGIVSPGALDAERLQLGAIRQLWQV